MDTLENPSKRFPMKDHYENTLVDLIFKDGTTLTLAGSSKLPYSIEFVRKVLYLFSSLIELGCRDCETSFKI